MAKFCLRLLMLTIASYCCGFSVMAASAVQEEQKQGGVVVTLRLTSQTPAVRQVQVQLTDEASGQAIAGARPAAWMQLRRSELVAAEASCDDKARVLTSGSLGARADVDLNGYRLVTLNQDRTLVFINPHVGLQNSKLESVVQLPGLGYDWLYVPATQRIFVTLRDMDQVAVVDVATRRLLTTVPTGSGSLPSRLSWDEAGQRVWVGLDGESAVVGLDAQSGQQKVRMAAQAGLHVLQAGARARWLLVTNSVASSVSLLDTTKMDAAVDVVVSETPVAAAWSDVAQRFVVLSINGGRLDLVDPVAKRVSGSLELARGALALGLFDQGRHALVLNSRTDTVSLIDLATLRVAAEMKVPGRPDQLSFARDFAYVRTQASSNVHVISLAQARAGILSSVVVPMGRASPQETPEAYNVTSTMSVAPEGNGILLANAGDATIYRYVQGMMVPVGSFSNYRRAARGLMVLDNSLSERATGVFETTARIEQAGRYDVIVRNRQPAITACFTVAFDDVPEAPGLPASAARLVLQLRQVRADSPDVGIVSFTLINGLGQAVDAADVVVLAMHRSGRWQVRQRATRVAPGTYQVTLHGLQRGEIDLMVRSEVANLAFDQGRLGRVVWPPESTLPLGAP